MIPTCTHEHRRSLVRRAAFALALLAPTAALAHPGHGSGFLPGLLHAFQGLDHLLAALAVGMWGARIGGRSAWALPLAFTGAMTFGTSLGLVLPAAEIMIALSVLALGLAVAANVRLATSAGAAVVALFAFFHGAAHGAEAPDAVGLAPYVLGLLGSTLALHLCGVTAALALRARPWLLRLAAAPVAMAGAALLASRLG